MKNRMILLTITSLCLALSGCGNSFDEKDCAESSRFVEESTISESSTVEQEKSSFESEDALKNKLLENVTLADGQELLTLYDDLGTYNGTIWYADGDECTCIRNEASYNNVFREKRYCNIRRI